MSGTKRKDEFEPYWQEEEDWLCVVEFRPHDDLLRLGPFPRKSFGYLFGYAHLTNTRSLARPTQLIGTGIQFEIVSKLDWQTRLAPPYCFPPRVKVILQLVP
jgi:hypothetical protein